MSAPTFDPALQNVTIRTAEGALYHAPTLADAMEGLGRHLQDGDGRGAVIFAGHPSDGAKVVLRVDLDGLPDVVR